MNVDAAAAAAAASTEKWIDASRAPSWTHLSAFLGATSVLVVGAFGVAYRVYWCRMPAIVALGVGVLAAVLYVRAKALKRDRSIKTVRSIYSLDYANVTQCAFAIGRHIQLTTSNYERLHYAPLRLWLLLLLWIAWIFYGAVFHSGEHVHTEDSLLIDLTGVGGDTPHLLRIARLYLLAANAAASIWFDAALPTRDDILERGGESSVGNDKSLLFTIVFVVLLFFPTPDSTPQALHALQLMSRTLAYAALFLACELFDNSLHYLRWLTTYSKSTADLLAGMQMALGNVVRRPLQQPQQQQQQPQQQPQIGATPPLVVSDVMRSFNLRHTLAQWSVIVRSAWILVASAEVNYLVPLQVLFMLALVTRARASVTVSVATNTSLLRLSHTAGGLTPPPSPTKAPPPPAPIVAAAAAATTTAAAAAAVVTPTGDSSSSSSKNKPRVSKKPTTPTAPTATAATAATAVTVLQSSQKQRKAHVHSSDSDRDSNDDSDDSNSDPECNNDLRRLLHHQIPRIGFVVDAPAAAVAAAVVLPPRTLKRKESTSSQTTTTTTVGTTAATTTMKKSNDLIEADSRKYAAAQITVKQ